jgi:hypothetical protein
MSPIGCSLLPYLMWIELPLERTAGPSFAAFGDGHRAGASRT